MELWSCGLISAEVSWDMNREMFKTDATVRFGQMLGAIVYTELLGMGNLTSNRERCDRGDITLTFITLTTREMNFIPGTTVCEMRKGVREEKLPVCNGYPAVYSR